MELGLANITFYVHKTYDTIVGLFKDPAGSPQAARDAPIFEASLFGIHVGLNFLLKNPTQILPNFSPGKSISTFLFLYFFSDFLHFVFISRSKCRPVDNTGGIYFCFQILSGI